MLINTRFFAPLIKKFQQHRYLFSILLILLLALILRFPFLSMFPPAMVQDEVGLGYSAISIAETGKDEWGESYPLFFKSFGDYKPPAFIYLTAGLYKLIGWHQVLPRITSAIAGVFTVFLTILWIKQITQSKKLGLLAGLIMATSPWAIHLSRMALESNLALTFFMAGLLFLSSQKSLKKIILSAVFFSLSSYTYHSYKYLIILFLLAYIFSIVAFHFKKLKNQQQLLKNLLFILLLSSFLSLPIFFAKGATGRMSQTLLLGSEDSYFTYKYHENNCHITLSKINPRLNIICRAQYNKFTRPVLTFFDSYLQHLSPGFYFFSGDSKVGRNPTQAGEFYSILFIFWICGFFKLLKNPKKQLLLVVGFLTAAIPSAASGELHAIRLSTTIPFMVLTIVIGYEYFQEKIYKHYLIDYLFVAILLLLTASFSIKYMSITHVGLENPPTFLSFAKKVAQIEHDYIEQNYTVYADYDLYPEPHIYYAYWNKIDPVVTQQSFANVLLEQKGFSRPKQFGERMIFERGSLNLIDCQASEIPKIVYIRKDQINGVTAIRVVKDNANQYDFAYVYEGWQLCENSRIKKN